MRSKAILSVSIAFMSCSTLFCPGTVFARNSTSLSTVDPNVTPGVAQRKAARMVPAEAVLDKGIDARKMQPGQQFQATLRSTIHMKNGLELPRNTELVGSIVTDKMTDGGTSRLALRFSKAELKDGKVIPIEADIMGVYPPSGGDTGDYSDEANLPIPWNGKVLQIDEPGAMSGVDFHGRIDGRSSGVFVSTKKDNIKLSSGSQLSLAIATRGASGMSGGA